MHESSPAGPNRATAIDREAAAWLARRDRGMSEKETANFLAWCAADPAHQAAFDRQEKAWRALDVLRGDPVLGAGGLPPRRRAVRRGVLVPLWLGLAAAVMLGIFLFTRSRVPAPLPERGASMAGLRVISAAPAHQWEDGSVVTENQGTRLEPQFTARERRVRLLAGEAHFKVAKDPQRPFLVETSGVVVRAVGTAFSVRRGEAVEVLVTEGRVAVEPSSGASAGAASPTIAAGEYALVAREGARVVATVNRASPAEIERKLAWQSARLQFSDLPLPDVIAAFNARNRTQLVLGDAASAAVRIDGTFRADNVGGFVRLLEGSFGIQADRSGDRIVLRQRR